MTRLRLLKVLVQTTFVVDDGETLTEQVATPVEIPAADWPNFAADLEEERQIAEVALNHGEETQAD